MTRWISAEADDIVIAIRSGAGASLLSRNDISMNARYPEVARRVGSASFRCERFAVDGEVVAFDGSSTSFARLAQRRRALSPCCRVSVYGVRGFRVAARPAVAKREPTLAAS